MAEKESSLTHSAEWARLRELDKDKPKLLLIAFRAWGDWLFTVPLLPYLFEKYRVHLECSQKVYYLVYDDPRFAGITVCKFEDWPVDTWPVEFPKRWQSIRDIFHPDKEINLNGSLELTCIAERHQEEFHYPVGGRRVVFGSNGFYDAVFHRAGIPLPNPLITTGMFFSEEQHRWAEEWRQRHVGEFVVMIGLSGSTMQKKFPNAGDVANSILNKYPEARIYLTGDSDCEKLVPNHPRIHSLCGDKSTVKQTTQLAGYVDMVIAPETFVSVAAGMWGTPKIQLCTTSSVYQICQYQKNDYSMQAPIWCSPCHRAIYEVRDCESSGTEVDGTPYAECTKRFSTNAILERVDKVYELWRAKQNVTV